MPAALQYGFCEGLLENHVSLQGKSNSMSICKNKGEDEESSSWKAWKWELFMDHMQTVALSLSQGWREPTTPLRDSRRCVPLYCTAWYYMVLYGLTQYCMVLRSIAWYCMIMHVTTSYCMVLHGLADHNISNFFGLVLNKKGSK